MFLLAILLLTLSQIRPIENRRAGQGVGDPQQKGQLDKIDWPPCTRVHEWNMWRWDYVEGGGANSQPPPLHHPQTYP